MAYESKNLSVLAYANGFTQWHYTTRDEAVTTANYFNPAASMLAVGDLIVTNLDTDGTASLKLFRVSTNAGGAVAVVAV